MMPSGRPASTTSPRTGSRPPSTGSSGASGPPRQRMSRDPWETRRGERRRSSTTQQAGPFPLLVGGAAAERASCWQCHRAASRRRRASAGLTRSAVPSRNRPRQRAACSGSSGVRRGRSGYRARRGSGRSRTFARPDPRQRSPEGPGHWHSPGESNRSSQGHHLRLNWPTCEPRHRRAWPMRGRSVISTDLDDLCAANRAAGEILDCSYSAIWSFAG